MSQQEDERVPYLEWEGGRSKLLSITDLDIGEGSVMKKVTGGMSVHEQRQGLIDMDPDCWAAIVLVSLRRDDPSITLEQVQSINLWEQINKWEAEGEGDPGVPLEPADSPELSSMPSAPVVEGLANGNDQRISGRRPLERSYT